MKRPAADTGAHSNPVRGAIFGLFSRSLLAVAGRLIVAGIAVQLIVSTQRLLTPVDVGGTLFGGSMDTVGNALIWAVAMGGVLLAALLRLPGFRLAWIAAGALPILFGALALWHYPDDSGGNQIFSPQRPEIVGMIALGGVFLVFGEVLRRYMTMPRLSGRRLRLLSVTFRLLAMTAMAMLFIAFPVVQQIESSSQPLPACAHDAMGRQLTLCLHPYDPTREAIK